MFCLPLRGRQHMYSLFPCLMSSGLCQLYFVLHLTSFYPQRFSMNLYSGKKSCLLLFKFKPLSNLLRFVKINLYDVASTLQDYKAFCNCCTCVSFVQLVCVLHYILCQQRKDNSRKQFHQWYFKQHWKPWKAFTKGNYHWFSQIGHKGIACFP